jgi:hypothetical protein
MDKLDQILAILKDIQNRLPKAKPQTDEAWLVGLRSDPAYVGIDIDHELRKMDRWLAQNPGRKRTRKFIENWLLRAEKTVTVKVPIAAPPVYRKKTESLPKGVPPPPEVAEKLSRVLGQQWGKM